MEYRTQARHAMSRARAAKSRAAEATLWARLNELRAPLLGPDRLGIGTSRGYVTRFAALRASVLYAEFEAEVHAQGGTVTELRWLGTTVKHSCRCPAGHSCAISPHKLGMGRNLCAQCPNAAKLAAEQKFRDLVERAGGSVSGRYVDTVTPVEVTCGRGHKNMIPPTRINQGVGICRVCAGMEWDAFYVVTSCKAVKFGVTSRSGRLRLGQHARSGFTQVDLLKTGLPGTLAPETERAVRAALALAGVQPVRGREYFDISCLALILDVANGWLSAAA